MYIVGERTCIVEPGTGKFMVNCSNMLVEDGRRLLAALMLWYWMLKGAFKVHIKTVAIKDKHNCSDVIKG